MEGLQGESLRQAQDLWVEDHKDPVREAINARRSYVLGEVHDWMVDQMVDRKMDKIPDADSIYRIAMRHGLNEGTPAEKKKMQALAVIYWDVLLPKICGVDFWSPTKRHYGLISTMKPKATRDDPNPEPYVDPSSEACLVWGFENAYGRWFHQAQFKVKNKGKKAGQQGYLDPLARTKEGKYVHEAANTKYTTATSGQAKWGGMTEAGRARLGELTDLITENRKERLEDIKGIESHLLELVREKHGRDKIDERRRQRRRSVAPVAEVQVEEIVDDAPEDFSKW